MLLLIQGMGLLQHLINVNFTRGKQKNKFNLHKL
jgi:hypothetical protein